MNSLREPKADSFESEGCPGLRLSDTAGEVWGALVENPAVGVAIVNAEGKLCFVNRRGAQVFLGAEPEEVVGKKLHEIFPKEWAAERYAIFDRLIETARPVIIRSIRKGVQIQSTLTLLDTPPGKPKRILVITSEGEHKTRDEQEHYEVVESELASLGPLEALSPRELEVLALLGHGLTIADIGKALYRSPKTIENHRLSIARKLQERNRAKLIEFARRAGLELRDAQLKRIDC